MELISIIVPVYKAEKYLSECIDSIISQTYENFELILIDDGSPDNSGKICDEYAEKDKRIKVIHKENAGVSSARNIGLDNASGEYIAFIDSDDFVDKQYLEKLHCNLKHNDADISLCRLSYYKKDVANIRREIFPKKEGKIWKLRVLFASTILCTPGIRSKSPMCGSKSERMAALSA